MPYVKCSKCHHEWETTDLKENCRWCESPIGKVLEEETPMEKMMDNYEEILRNIGGNNVR